MTGVPILVPIQKESAMAKAAFAERTNKTVRTGRRAFPAAGLVAMCLAVAVPAVGSSRGDENTYRPVQTGAAVTKQDDARLWLAGTTGDYYHNGVLVLPEEWQQHQGLVSRFIATGDQWRALFARTIKEKDAANERCRLLAAAAQSLQVLLVPAVLERTEADAVLTKWFEGRKPAWPVTNPEGRILPGIDELRKAKAFLNDYAIQRHRINTSIADQVEAYYRKALGNKTLPEDVGLHFREHLHGTAKIAYAGAKPLTNVVVVTRAAMRPAGPKAEATRRLVDLINETADPGADANKDAAHLMRASKILHETAQAAFVYIPVLEPGDDLVVDMYEQGFYWDVLEAKVSVYSDTGAVLDKVMFVGGPHNDLSLPAQERKRRTKPPPKEKPLGPVFTQLARAEIVLKKDAAGPFERCVPVGTTYLPVGVRDALEAGKPLEVLARSADAYVAVGPKKQTGRALVLVPRSAVAKLNDLSKIKTKPRMVQPIEKPTWLLLAPPANGSNDYQLVTASSLVKDVCTTTGGTAGLAVRPGELVRALAVGEDDYVVVLPKPLSDGSILALVPKSVVKEVKVTP